MYPERFDLESPIHVDLAYDHKLCVFDHWSWHWGSSGSSFDCTKILACDYFRFWAGFLAVNQYFPIFLHFWSACNSCSALQEWIACKFLNARIAQICNQTLTANTRSKISLFKDRRSWTKSANGDHNGCVRWSDSMNNGTVFSNFPNRQLEIDKNMWDCLAACSPLRWAHVWCFWCFPLCVLFGLRITMALLQYYACSLPNST